MIISWHNDTQGEIFCRTQAQVWGDGWADKQNDLLTQNEKKTLPGINCPHISKTYKPVNVNRFFFWKKRRKEFALLQMVVNVLISKRKGL